LSASLYSGHSSSISKQQQSLAQNQQNNDLNYIMALSYVTLKRPSVFIKNTQLTDFLCSNLLFTSKAGSLQADKLFSALSNSSSTLKSKNLQPNRSPSPQNSISILATICNLLYLIFENESNWPEIFVKAYVDDSLSERNWVDNPNCKDFLDNIQTAFHTKPIPFSTIDQQTQPSTLASNNSNSDLQNLKSEDSLLNEVLSAASGGDFSTDDGASGVSAGTKRSHVLRPRYESIRSEIEVIVADMIRNYINNKSRQPVKRLLGQPGVGISSGVVGAGLNMVDNRNFLKLLQMTCGLGEIRAISLSKIELWLQNPKVKQKQIIFYQFLSGLFFNLIN
jgi:hypothetical protein